MRVFVEEDFFWYEIDPQFKEQIVAVANKIIRENDNCKQLDTESSTKSPSRSKPGDPVFFFTCDSGDGLSGIFNVFFRPTDAEAVDAFAAIEPLAKSAATDACEMAAKRAANNPSTVKFSRIMDLAYLPHVSGRARVVSTFKAKNTFGLELEYRIDCSFDGASLIDTSISEKAN